MANEFTRITHAASGGSQLVDINADQSQNLYFLSGYGNDTYYANMPCLGYDKISLKRTGNCNSATLAFLDSGGSVISSESIGTTWSNWFSIPSNAILARVSASMNTASSGGVVYGLKIPE